MTLVVGVSVRNKGYQVDNVDNMDNSKYAGYCIGSVNNIEL